jgi:hypothetical protein
MLNTITGAGAASRYSSESGSNQLMRLRLQLRNTAKKYPLQCDDEGYLVLPDSGVHRYFAQI